MNENYIFIGIDPHKEQHVAVIIKNFDVKITDIKFKNHIKGFKKLIEIVNTYCVNGLTPIYGIENAYGYGRNLSIYLTGSGYVVKDVNTSEQQHSLKKVVQPQ